MSTPKKPKQLVYNGRFSTQKTTGVQRVARELIAALVRVQPQGSITVLVPPHADATVDGTTTLKVGFSKGVIWEQLALPLFSSRNRIVNLSNSASVFLGNQIIYMHDAAVFDTPAHFSRLFRAWYRVMFWILARTSLCVLTNSRFSRNRLAHHCGVSTKKISVVPLGADHLDALEPDASILKTLSLTPGRFVLAVSSMNPTKNFGRLIAAFRQLNDASVDLVIVGMRNAAVFGTQDDIAATEQNIKYAGYISDEQLKALYQHAVCFLYPSIYEGFGIPPLEAMRQGCPTLVGRSAALPEVCGDAALYCDPYSRDDIAEKLRNLLDSAELRADLKRRGYSHAAQYSWSKSAEMMTRIFDSL